jgi:hypothetical protein
METAALRMDARLFRFSNFVVINHTRNAASNFQSSILKVSVQPSLARLVIVNGTNCDD